MELPIICSNCGQEIDGSIDGQGRLNVDLCEDCTEKIKSESYDEGYNNGHDKGYEEGCEEVMTK